MRKSILVDLLKLLIIFGAIWGVFTFLPLTCQKPDLQISIDNEEKLGDLIVNEVFLADKRIKIIHTPQLDSAMFCITKKLLDNIGLTDYEYKIQVINDESVNAFTLPGGYIFVNQGLVDFAEHPEELAAVLAHEIGHAEKRHVVAKLIKEIGVALLFTVVGGGDNIILGEIGRTALSSVFDRQQEEEADMFALNLLEKSSINPAVIATFFRRLNNEIGGYNENLEILMTHPHNNSRIKSALEYKTSEGFKSEEFDLDWQAVKASLKD